MNEVKMVPEKPHKVTIDSRERTTVTGVTDIDRFDESEIIFITTAGAVTLTGYDLHIGKLDLADGTLVITGRVQALDYADHDEQKLSGKAWGKLFK